MSGYCAIGRIALATSPAITMMIAMTPASTGRSMKNFENMSVGRGGGGRRRARLLGLRDDGAHETTLRSFEHGSLRNCDHLLRAGIETDRRELAGKNLELWIRKRRAQLHRAE